MAEWRSDAKPPGYYDHDAKFASVKDVREAIEAAMSQEVKPELDRLRAELAAAHAAERDWELMAKSEYGVDGMSDFIDAIRKERREHWQNVSRLASLLKAVTLDEMGGTPDLAGPNCPGGWDEFDEEVCDALRQIVPCHHTAQLLAPDKPCPRCWGRGTTAVAWRGRGC